MYEIHSDYGCSVLETEQDAVNALWLLGSYHGLTIEPEQVRKGLETDGYYECFPLAVSRCG